MSAKAAVPVVLRPTPNPDVWMAESRSEPDVRHSITHDRFGWGCSCPARKRCAHIDALIDQLAADSPAPSTTEFDESEWIDPSQDWAAPHYPEHRTPKPESEKPETMTTSAWSNPNFTKDAERGSGYEPPVLDDDIYFAEIVEVGEPFDQAKFDEPNVMQTRFYVQWQLDEAEGVPEEAQLRQYMTLPDAYLNSGYLNEKSNLFKLMETLGYDMKTRFRVDPPSWVGKRARLVVKNKPDKEGSLRPRIDQVMTLKKSGAAPRRNRNEDDE